ncbi:MAG: GNAT family N-acetyltransferase [Alkalispirochaetaceae bacterium]
MVLELLPFELMVLRLDPSSAVPEWTEKSRFLSLFRGAEELSIICESALPADAPTSEADWCALKLAGSQPFTMTGILASILKPLADGEVSILAISTYDTDYVLVKRFALEKAVDALRGSFDLRYAATGLPLSRRLDTDRMELRRFRDTDLEMVFDYASSEENTRFLSWCTHQSREDTQRFLNTQREAILKGNEYNYAVVDRKSGRMIGSAGLSRFDSQLSSAELGYVLHRDFWGRGYATEISAELLRYGFEELGFRRIHAYCFTENGASRRVLEKSGMRYLGVEGVQTLRQKDPVASYHFEILRQEYSLAVAGAADEGYTE